MKKQGNDRVSQGKALPVLVWRPFQLSSYRMEWRRHKLVGVLKELGRDLKGMHHRIWKGYCDYDLFAIDDWFLSIMPNMLQEFVSFTNSYPNSFYQQAFPNGMPEDEEEQKKLDDEAFSNWKHEIEKMILLFRKANEASELVVNRYEEEYRNAHDAFEKEYGLFGDKLNREGKANRIHFMSEVEEYKPISDLYFTQEKEDDDYRAKCCVEGLMMFTKYFHDLWD